MSTNGTTTHAHADADGHFRRKPSAFRDTISKDANAKYPAEKGRYLLYMNYGCPWAHRAVLVRKLKGLEEVVELAVTDFDLSVYGDGRVDSREQVLTGAMSVGRKMDGCSLGRMAALRGIQFLGPRG